MLTSKEAKNNANNHSLQACQSGTWKTSGSLNGSYTTNTSRLQGYVGGTLISVNASNNPAYGKTAFISFAVPAGTSYQITSYPTENTSCGAGVFSVFGYQT
ncbi:prepilin, shufflon protein A [Escherichia coli]